MSQKFPITVKRGSVTVKIYRTQNSKGYVYFQVAFYDGGRLVKDTYSNLEEARSRAAAIAQQLASGSDCVVLQGQEKLAYDRAVQLLSPTSARLDTAIESYVEAISTLPDRTSIKEVVAFYLKHHNDQVCPKQVRDVVDELVRTRQHDGSTPKHVADLKSRLGRFAAAFQVPINAITSNEITSFLKSLKLAPKTRKHYREAVSNLMTFARMNKYVPGDYKPMEFVEGIKEPVRDVHVLSPGELRRILKKARPEMLPLVVLAAFGGFRTSEIERMRWERDIGQTEIKVPPHEQYRVKSVRQIVMNPTLKQWVQHVRSAHGKVVPFNNVSNQLDRIAEDCGLKHKHNALRHSYGTYRLKLIKNLFELAEEMGNSPRIIRKHYARSIDLETANEWFNILPSSLHNITVLPPAERSGEQAVNQPMACDDPLVSEERLAV